MQELGFSEGANDGKVQCGAEEEKSTGGREKESNTRGSINWEAQEQATATLYLWQTQTQAVQEMAQSMFLCL